MENEKKKKPFLSTFSKVIVFLSIIYGWILTTVSYIWAAMGYEPLTDLSSTIVSTIVGPVITYLCTNALCTIFEKNKLSFSTPLSRLEKEDEMYEYIDESDDSAQKTSEEEG